ncbi:MAG: hypothetical protein ACRD4I_17835 [Candidatus Angelobacter sp.]
MDHAFWLVNQLSLLRAAQLAARSSAVVFVGGGASSVVGGGASWWEWWSSAVVSASDQWSSARCPARQAAQTGELQSEQR